ncbi:hypothetical protein PybrP1_008744 [[Pythium] brassicae (nom. inval.)]|nr:hypothetical protein PybrP1_008744 [[Pythium] brassicae (nom. inval.)]
MPGVVVQAGRVHSRPNELNKHTMITTRSTVLVLFDATLSETAGRGSRAVQCFSIVSLRNSPPATRVSKLLPLPASPAAPRCGSPVSPRSRRFSARIKPSALDGSVLIYPGGKTRCAFDDFTDPTGNFKSNKTYFFQVFPNKAQQAKKKVMLYFQGGGGCIDDDTCSFSIQCSLGKSSTFTTVASAYSTGVLNRTNPDNVFKDWDIVHIPYCTGDLHAGSKVLDLPDSPFASFLGQPQCLGQKMKTHMSGYENSASALKWALANYPNPEHLVIGGASAGSLAAQAMSALVADMWKVKDSSIRYSVLADSYFGVFPEEVRSAGSSLDYLGVCDVDLKAPADVVAGCKGKTMSTIQLMSSLMKQMPFSEWLFIDSKADRTQRTFYQLSKDGILGYPFTNIISATDFFAQAVKMISAYRSVSSRISTFYVEGEKHVFTFYEGYANTVSDAGDKLGAVLSQWLGSSGSSTPAPSSSPAPAPSSGPAPAPSSGPAPAPSSSKAPAPAPSSGPAPAPSSSKAPTPAPAPSCAVDSIKPSALDGSVLIYPGGKTRCAFDDFTHPNSSFSTNKTFFFQVFPSKAQEKSKLLLIFQGGGACIDPDTCSFSIQCSLGKSRTFNPNADAYSTGVFNRSNPDNVFRDWNVVHVPYCTGDLHVGNTLLPGNDSLYASLLSQPQCLQQNLSTHMSGYENSLAALKWALANYPKPTHLIVGGASAGSLAAQALSVLIADMWNVTAASNTRYSIVGDSYVGVFPEAKRPAGAVVDFFGTCDVDLKAPADVVAACKAKTMSTKQLMTALLKQVPFSEWVFINSKFDATQRLFYQLMNDGIAGYPFANLVSGEAFYKNAVALIDAYRAVSSRILTFFVEGEKHVFMADEGYGAVLSDAGVTLSTFLAKMLDGSALPASASTPAPTTGTPQSAAPAPATAAALIGCVVALSAVMMLLA